MDQPLFLIKPNKLLLTQTQIIKLHASTPIDPNIEIENDLVILRLLNGIFEMGGDIMKNCLTTSLEAIIYFIGHAHGIPNYMPKCITITKGVYLKTKSKILKFKKKKEKKKKRKKKKIFL